jgi:anaerobic magnesium-protoporphyrin IX monomethyl ester cyclase
VNEVNLMKILFIDPPFYRFMGYYNRYFPLGLASLAAVLHRKGHEVLIYDADSKVNPSKMNFIFLEESYPLYLSTLKDSNHPVWLEMNETLRLFAPDAVGITIWTTFAASAFKTAYFCKQYNKKLPVIAGGPHCTIKPDEVMKICQDIDFLVRGEGEETLPELIENLKYRRTTELIKNIKGITYRLNGQIVHTPDREFIEDLDIIDFPARNLLLNKHSYDAEDMGLLMTTRGCPYSCSYCATNIWKRKVRYRSIDNVIAEIKLINNTYGTRQFTLKDDSFTINRKRVLEFCDRLIDEKLNINWDCNTRVNLVDEELLRKMKQAGCNSIKVGIETGSERMLKLINKGITCSQARHTAKLLRKAGIYWTAYFMMGLPSETEEEIYQTLQFMKELKPDFASLSVYEPFPGTDLFEIGIQNNLVQEERTMQDFFSISPKYYYVKYLNRRIDTMSNARLEQLEFEIKQQFDKYNKGFVRIAKRARSRSNLYLHNPFVILSDMKKLRSWLR